MTTVHPPASTPTSVGPKPTVAELRHRAEVPMLVLATLLTIVGVGAAIWYATQGTDIPGWASGALFGLAVPFMAGLVFIRYNYWNEIANGVEVTDRQFPEVYAIYSQLAAEMGIDPLPRLYLKNGNGLLNAFASRCTLRRSYVVIYSDLLDIAYEHGDFNGVKFVLAHELGHIHCEHVALWRQGIRAVPEVLFLGRTLTRAQEYTADRCAAYYAPEGAKAMTVLFAGKRLYPRVDIDAYQDSVRNHPDGFWLRVVNFLSSHAVGFRRMEPLLEIEEKGWDVHGRMF